ncbi:hypothetical protein [Cytobacillus gottheilii]|uniref:Methionyl-tRNA formyltransferase n=1 Tax=Cytobacillus gottheilii TaxID=859144 RepID=A0ABX8FF26_9BACI|nr:hypothetical protein [Cytobacillus gottheilii]QVY62602.1 hypothetical protein J1899_05940 [Cytobacillus gottheilii]
MALVSKIDEISRSASIHDEVEASYNVVRNNGEIYVQVNTYGSPERKIKGKVSQSIQFSSEVIMDLYEIINKDF